MQSKSTIFMHDFDGSPPVSVITMIESAKTHLFPDGVDCFWQICMPDCHALHHSTIAPLHYLSGFHRISAFDSKTGFHELTWTLHAVPVKL
jgi:hypothetical protein